jgi:fluoroquinolone transport system permease protein
MFKLVLVHELKNMIRDKMYAFFLVYPIIISVVAYFLIPYLKDINPLASDITFLTLLLINSFIFGVVTSFTLLDDQDDNVLLSLKMTPISVRLYVLFKLLMSYVFGIISTLLILISVDYFQQTSLRDILFILILAPIQGPILAMLIASVSRNKVEGFAIMKLSGLILMVPIAALFLTDWKELLISIFPGFWTARLFSMQFMPLDYFLKESYIYFILGIMANLLLFILFYKIYIKKKEI